MNTCSINEKECQGICPESRVKCNQKNDCPALYWKEPIEKKIKLHENEYDK